MQTHIKLLLTLLIGVLMTTAISRVHAQTEGVPDALAAPLEQLTIVKLKHTATLLDEMAATGQPELVGLFEVMLAGQLYFEKSSKALFELTKNSDGSYQARSLFTPSNSQSSVKKTLYKKIRVNNKLRGKLRELIALVQINSSDVALRQQAVTTMVGNVTPSIKDQLEQRLNIENDNGDEVNTFGQ